MSVYMHASSMCIRQIPTSHFQLAQQQEKATTHTNVATDKCATATAKSISPLTLPRCSRLATRKTHTYTERPYMYASRMCIKQILASHFQRAHQQAKATTHTACDALSNARLPLRSHDQRRGSFISKAYGYMNRETF